MDIILTESQYIKILKESKENEIEKKFSDSKEFTKNILSNAKKQFGIDFTFLATWGSVIGGFVGPVSKYMQGMYPNLTDTDLTLISLGIILTYFSSNKEKLHKVLQLIKEKKLITFFDRALDKTYDLKEAFFGFLESLNITFSKVSNMIAYTFLVPLVPLLKNIAELSLDESQIKLIGLGISSYVGGIIASNFIYNLVKKIIERFRS